MVKVGSEQDSANKKYLCLGNPYTGVPDTELETKARLLGLCKKDIRATEYPVYNYGEICVEPRLSAYIGTNYTPTGSVPPGVDADKVTKSMQKWYFEYSLPGDVHAVGKGFDVTGFAKANGGVDFKEDIWKKDGYLVVNFDITTYEDGFSEKTGQESDSGWLEGSDVFTETETIPIPRLNYINAGNVSDGYCNMAKLEGFRNYRTDYRGVTFHYLYGDTLMYDLERSAKKDYHSYGTH